jgi:hypothetical protein
VEEFTNTLGLFYNRFLSKNANYKIGSNPKQDGKFYDVYFQIFFCRLTTEIMEPTQATFGAER